MTSDDAHSPAVVPVGRPTVLALGGAHAVAVIGAPADPLVTNYSVVNRILVVEGGPSAFWVEAYTLREVLTGPLVINASNRHPH